MESLKSKRIPLRSAFTRTFNSLKEILDSSQPDLNSMEEILEQLIDKSKRLREADNELLNFMLENGALQKDYDKEFDSCEEYSDKVITCKLKVKKCLSTHRGGSVSRDGVSGIETTTAEVSRTLRLPEISLKQFDGDPRSWLNFWNTFKKIHEDLLLDEHSKFVYLIQSMTPKSKAYEIVNSYPTTTENYQKVIQHLKDRFGRDDTLIQVYVRDLLQLVLCNNSISRKDTLNLSSLYDNLETKLRSLESLGVTEDKYASILFPLVESCLPHDILRIWERDREKTIQGKSELCSILEFLRNEVMSEERIILARTTLGFDRTKKSSKINNTSGECNVATANDLIVGDKFKEKYFVKKPDETCIFCDKCHLSEKCFKASLLSYEDKRSLILKKGACFMCLKRNHISRNCKAKIKCVICGKKHCTVMCQNIPPSEGTKPASECRKLESGSGSSDNVLTSQVSDSAVLLQTLNVRVKHGDREKIVRAVIDTGSERTYLSEDIIKSLNYKSCGEIKLIHKLFGGVETNETKHHKYKIHLSSLDNCFKCDMHCLDTSVICSNIRRVPNGPWLRELNKYGIRITDIENNAHEIENEIKLLIGSDVAGTLFTGNVKSLESGPVAVETRLGWTLMGKIPGIKPEMNNSLMVISSLLNDSSISNLWKLDIIGITDPVETKSKSEKDLKTKTDFFNSVKTNEEGRYEITLPWKEEHLPLPSNMNLARKRLEKTTSKLKEENRYQTYENVFNEWLSLGIIEELSAEVPEPKTVHYLPHRPVFKENSTTKIRPVFDASAKEKGSPSLNQCLEPGLNLIELIPYILLRFRQYKYGVISDIEKAFLQISVRKEDRDFLRFFWWDPETNRLKIFRHTRVVFGVVSSPFLLGAVIEFHLQKCLNELKYNGFVLNRLLKSFYVDNVVTSVENIKELEQFVEESTRIMSEGKFNLRGWQWTGNDSSAKTPVLGLIWDQSNDVLGVNLEWLERLQIKNITKRVILSLAHKVFDPVGFLSPVLLTPKLLLQKIWKTGLSWDEEVDEDSKEEFKKWIKDLHLLKDVQIERWIKLSFNEKKKLSIHTFCDASKQAYAAVVFLRVCDHGEVSVHLLASKARVAPTKPITIPRLELMAATVGARLCSSVLEVLENISDISLYFWTDSTTTLTWILKEENWTVFVNNRVREIRKLTKKEEWRHLPGLLNPADLPSRGCNVTTLLTTRWWEGPSWLRMSEDYWPTKAIIPDEKTVSEEKGKSFDGKISLNLAVQSETCEWYSRYFSSYEKMIRMLSWLMRFMYNCKQQKQFRRCGELSLEEIQSAEKKIIKFVQEESFTSETDKRLKSLNAYKDEEGIIRVKTQVIYREDTVNFRYPVLLPSDHPVVQRLIFWKHQELLHAGVAQLMTALRENYWILKARKTIRAVVQKCVRCKRFSAQKIESESIALPADRVQDAAVFQTIGVDLAGPLYIKNGKKSWIVLYTCAVYRAIHLELVTSLSTEAFLQSFRRFIARRGRPTTVYSDNGTNFIGANKAFSDIDWEHISAAAAVQRIRWKFNPPTAAWWGGWWERLIQLVKRILRKVLGRASLSYEELITILCDCEQVVNSRPLTYVTEDLNDLAPLTPSMFLQEIRSLEVIDIDAIDTQALNKRIKYRQQVREHLRRRFRIEYLGQLRQRNLLQKNIKPLAIGDVVLLETDKRRAYWVLARIQELILGKDGHPRVVRVKTESGELLRPIQKLYHLEIPEALSRDPVLRTRSGRTVTVPKRYQN